MTAKLTSDFTPKQPGSNALDPTFLETVSGQDPEMMLESTVQSAAADAKILPTEINGGLTEVVKLLENAKLVEPAAASAIIASLAPDIAKVNAAIIQSIAKVKEATPAGMLLSQQLQSGAITQAQFNAGLEEISVPSSVLLSSIAKDIKSQSIALLLAVINDPTLKVKPALGVVEDKSTAASSNLGSVADKTTAIDNSLPPKPDEIHKESHPAKYPVPDNIITSKQPAQEAKADVITAKLIEKMVVADEDAGSYIAQYFKKIAKIIKQNLAASASSLISLRPQPKFMTAARAIIKINGKRILYCNSINYEIGTEWTEVRGVDETLPNDLVPGAVTVRGSMSIYRQPNHSPGQNWWQADMFRGIVWPFVTIEIRDKRTDEIILLIPKAAITNRTETIAQNTITSSTLSFIGMGFRDELTPEYISDDVMMGTEDGKTPFAMGMEKIIGK